MKNKLLYLLALLTVLGTACIKTQNVTPTPPPSGTFTGVFGYLHRSTDKTKFDTLKTNLTLKLNSTDGTFTVTVPDTSSVHAASNGTYQLNSELIQFVDKIIPTNGAIDNKKHLNGTYLYAYNGSVLQMLVNIGDTVSMQYQLTKTSN